MSVWVRIDHGEPGEPVGRYRRLHPFDYRLYRPTNTVVSTSRGTYRRYKRVRWWNRKNKT